MRFDPIPFNIGPAFFQWLVVAGIFVAAVLVVWLILAIVFRGPIGGLQAVVRAVSGGFSDLLSVSPGRVFALSNLTFKESVRRKALLVFVVFAILFMFGAWFLPDANVRSQLQIKVYISFVLTAISWLLVPVMLLLACWGLPEDIRLRSLHTVVTKPARRLEIVLGRMIGYSSVGLLLLALMSGVGYIWLSRQVRDMQDLDCRVPVYGSLEFIDREGKPADAGINVGDKWMFRSYVEGATKSRAIWHFDDIDESSLTDGKLKLESMFESFRTTKGRDMTKGLIAQFTLVNNVREKAFYEVAKSEILREAANFMREGQFDNAADSLDSTADTFRNTRGQISPSGLTIAADGLKTAAEAIESIESDGDWQTATVEALRNVAREFNSTAELAMTVELPDYKPAADTVAELARVVREDGATLKEKIPRVEVPLPPFEVREYRDGENVTDIDRELTYEGGDEDVVRFLAGLFNELQESGTLVDNDGLSAATMDQLVIENRLSLRNVEILNKVFGDLMTGNKVTIADGKIQLPEGQSFFALFDELANEGKIAASDGWKLKADLFDDLVANGQLTVSVACQSLTQYLGMARPDLFVKLPDKPFHISYFKAILAIGLMLVLIICLGVTASCFVKGPVAILLTTAFVIIGKPMHEFMKQFVNREVEGGGLFSSVYRLVYHMNPSSEIEASPTVLSVIKYGDAAANSFPDTISHIIPNFNYFTSTAEYVENGFDVPWSAGILPCIATTLAYLIPCVIIGLFTLKYRELESK